MKGSSEAKLTFWNVKLYQKINVNKSNEEANKLPWDDQKTFPVATITNHKALQYKTDPLKHSSS